MLKLMLLTAVWLVWPGELLAARVIVVASIDLPLHQEILAGMRDRFQTLNANHIEIEATTQQGAPALIEKAVPDQLIVSIGTDNTLQVLSLQSRLPLVGAAIPRLNYDELHSRYADNIAAGKQGRFRALLLDQPLTRRFNLIEEVIPGVRHVSLSLGSGTRDYVGDIEAEARRRGLNLHTGLVLEESQLIGTLDRILEQSDVMLGLLDPVVFNRANSRNILLTAYRWRVPLIGISPGYVRAGALAAVYTTPTQIGWQLAETIVEHYAVKGNDESSYLFPKYFEVTVNYQVAEAMGLQIEDEGSLKRKLEQRGD